MIIMYHLKSYGVQPAYETKPWSLEDFKKNFDIKIISESPTELEFDLINANCALANTLRRIILVEVPAMAIEKVFMYQNTSMIQDEVLAHRLGLIPLDVDPRLFSHLSSACPETDNIEKLSENECLMFELNVKWTKDAAKAGGSFDQESGNGEKRAFGCRSVYAHEMKWIPIGSQMHTLDKVPVKPVRLTPDEPGILLAKLAPHQEIHLRCLAVKGVGKDHAKFSPVATASYRLHPRIKLRKKIRGELAYRLQSCFPKGVIEVDAETKVARVANERLEVRNSREFMRDEDLRDAVEVSLDGSHFIFTVESTGALTAVDIVEQALLILANKCDIIDISLSTVDD